MLLDMISEEGRGMLDIFALMLQIFSRTQLFDAGQESCFISIRIILLQTRLSFCQENVV